MSETMILSFLAGVTSVLIGAFIYIEHKWRKFYKKVKLDDGTVIYIWKSFAKNDSYSVAIGTQDKHTTYLSVKDGKVISANFYGEI